MGGRFHKTNKKWVNRGNEVLWIGNAKGGIKDEDLGEILSTTEMYNIMGAIYGCNTPKT